MTKTAEQQRGYMRCCYQEGHANGALPPNVVEAVRRLQVALTAENVVAVGVAQRLLGKVLLGEKTLVSEEPRPEPAPYVDDGQHHCRRRHVCDGVDGCRCDCKSCGFAREKEACLCIISLKGERFAHGACMAYHSVVAVGFVNPMGECVRGDWAGRRPPTDGLRTDREKKLLRELRMFLNFNRSSFSRISVNTNSGSLLDDSLPKTEADVDRFIANRTKLWRQSWIFPLLDELERVDVEACKRADQDPSFRCSRCSTPVPIGGEGVPELCPRCIEETA
jgi:hypothetical protein